MAYEDITLLESWLEQYYKEAEKVSSLNGIKFSYYKSMRGYFRHSIILTDIKEKEFGLVDYKVWERVLTKTKSGRNPMESGGLFFRYKDYSDLCSERAWFNTKKKLIDLELLVATPFRDFFVLNPRYIIKMYNPKMKECPKSEE